MKTRLTHFLNHAIFISTLFFVRAEGRAQSGSAISQDKFSTPPGFEVRIKSFLLPQVQPKWKYSQAISLSYIMLPAQWTLNPMNAPMLAYSGKLGLPLGFDFQSSLSTIVISNLLEFGPSWNYSFEHFHFGMGWRAGYSFGFLTQMGYDTRVSGWEQEPFLAIGHDFKRNALTLKASLHWTNSVVFNEGGHTLISRESFFNGYSFSASLEHRLYRSKVAQFTIKLNSLQYYFLAWPVFPNSQSRYLMPECSIGLNL